MSFVDAVKSGLRNYAVFKGRAGRGEYWWFVLDRKSACRERV